MKRCLVLFEKFSPSSLASELETERDRKRGERKREKGGVECGVRN